MIKVNKEDYSKYYIQGSDHYLIPKDEFVCLLKEIKELQSQLSYLRSGEYYNQLRFENEMLQNVVDTNGIPSEVYDYIECTHRNTELLEENEQLKKELKILSDNYKEMDKFHKSSFLNRSNYIKELEKENQQLKEQQKEFINYLKSMLENEKDNFSVARVKDVLEKYKEIVGDKQ